MSAPAIERVVTDAADRWLGNDRPNDVLAVRLSADGAIDLATRLSQGERIIHATSKIIRVLLPLELPLRGGQRHIAIGQKPALAPDTALIAALRKAHRMVTRERGGSPLVEVAPISPYDRTIMRLAFLSPDLQRDILFGRQPPSLNLERLRTKTIPLCWSEERIALGWPNAR